MQTGRGTEQSCRSYLLMSEMWSIVFKVKLLLDVLEEKLFAVTDVFSGLDVDFLHLLL